MKRFALLLMFIIPLLQYSNGQRFQAGFYGGAMATDIPGTDNIDNDADFTHLGFVIAGTVSTQITPKTRLQMEIRFLQKGAQQNPVIVIDSTGNSTNSNPNSNNYTQGWSNYFKLKLNYVDMNFGIKHAIHFSIRNKATDRYGIEAGVGIGALVSYSYEVNSVNYSIDLSTLDISPYIGVYYNITPHFYVEVRYSNSVNSVVKADNSNSKYFYNIYYGTWNTGHNTDFSFSLGFLFGSTPQANDSKSASTSDTQDN